MSFNLCRESNEILLRAQNFCIAWFVFQPSTLTFVKLGGKFLTNSFARDANEKVVSVEGYFFAGCGFRWGLICELLPKVSEYSMQSFSYITPKPASLTFDKFDKRVNYSPIDLLLQISIGLYDKSIVFMLRMERNTFSGIIANLLLGNSRLFRGLLSWNRSRGR